MGFWKRTILRDRQDGKMIWRPLSHDEMKQDLKQPKRSKLMQLTAFGKSQLTLVFLLFTFWQATAQQPSPKVTLQEKNVSLKKVFNDISKQTGISVMYDEALIRNTGPVSIDVRNVSLSEAMQACLHDKQLGFV